MTTMPTFEEALDYRQEAMQSFIDRNEYQLDAQMVSVADPDSVAVYAGSDEDLCLVEVFDNVPDFEDWVGALDRMDFDAAVDMIEQRIIEQRDIVEDAALASFKREVMAQTYDDSEVYELDDPKRGDYVERMTA